MGSIDERAIESLSFVANISNLLHMKSNYKGLNAEFNEISKFFPTFSWVIRDFSLELVDRLNNNVKQYYFMSFFK